MGKASSSKKVARAARAGGASTGSKRKLGFPLAIVAICVVGLAVVVVARGQFSEASAEAPTVSDHWHAAYGMYVCDEFLPPLTDAGPDTTGVHTHGDGVIHIHPFVGSAAGRNATLAKWGEVVGVDFDGGSFTVGGTTYEDGYDCGGEPATVSIYRWPADSPDAEPEVFTSDLGSIRLDEDRAEFTFAVVPEGTEVPRPPSVDQLDNLIDMPGYDPGPEPGTGTEIAPQGTPGGTADADAGAGADAPPTPSSDGTTGTEAGADDAP